MDIKKNKIYPIGNSHAIVFLQRPNDGKFLYCVIEYPSRFDEENFTIVAADEELFKCLLKSVEVIGYNEKKSYDIMRKIIDQTEIYEKYDKLSPENRKEKMLEIPEGFCIQEMGVLKDQYDDMKPIHWSSIFYDKSDGSIYMSNF